MRLAALRRVLQKRGRDPKPPGPDFLSYHRAGPSPSSRLRTHQNLWEEPGARLVAQAKDDSSWVLDSQSEELFSLFS